MSRKITLENGEEVKISDESYKEFEKAVQEPKRWRAKKAGKYYFVDGDGDVMTRTETNHEYDDYRYNTGNYFKTEKEAEHHKKYVLAQQKIKDSGDEVDWADEDSAKYSVYYDWLTKELDVDSDYIWQHPEVTYYNSEENAEKALKDLEEEYLTVCGVNPKI